MSTVFMALLMNAAISSNQPAIPKRKPPEPIAREQAIIPDNKTWLSGIITIETQNKLAV